MGVVEIGAGGQDVRGGGGLDVRGHDLGGDAACFEFRGDDGAVGAWGASSVAGQRVDFLAGAPRRRGRRGGGSSRASAASGARGGCGSGAAAAGSTSKLGDGGGVDGLRGLRGSATASAGGNSLDAVALGYTGGQFVARGVFAQNLVDEAAGFVLIAAHR